MDGAFEHAGLGPALDERDFFGGEAAVVGESAVGIGGEPGRHVAALRDVGGQCAPASGVGIGREGEGPGPALVVAGGAMSVEDGSDLAVVSDGRFGGADTGVRELGGGDDERGR